MKKILFVLIALCTFAFISNAQELRMPKYGFLDNWSMSVGVGANMTFSDNYDIIKPQNWGPDAWISLNKDWSPILGTRLNLGWGQNGIYSAGNKMQPIEYLQMMRVSPNRLDAGLDFTFNPINLFNTNYDRKFNVLAIVGLGYSHTFQKTMDEEIIPLASSLGVETTLPKNNYIVPKVGVQLNYAVSKPVAIFLEGTFKVYSDKLDLQSFRAQYDGVMTLTAGITYKFKNHDGTRGFQYIPSYDQKDIDNLNNEINDLREQLDKKPVEVIIHDTVVIKNEVTKDTLLPTTVRFTADSYKVEDTQLTNLQNVAEYLKANKDVKLTVVGSADKETGTSDYNLDLSSKRAEAVKQVLVEEFGVNPEQLITKAEGDTNQRYSNSKWNRAVIIVK